MDLEILSSRMKTRKNLTKPFIKTNKNPDEVNSDLKGDSEVLA